MKKSGTNGLQQTVTVGDRLCGMPLRLLPPHTAIYAGDGKAIDASSAKLKVVCRKIYDTDRQVMDGRPALLRPS